jgi:predicted  nucleic acid-binding Zn-ribbon protein
MGIGERIDIALGLLKEDDTYDNRLEVMANLQVMKEVVENIPGLKDISPVNVSKNAAGEIVIPGNGNDNNSIQNNCNKLITKIKGFKEIQNNPELLKVFGILQNQIKNIKPGNKNGGNDNQNKNGESEERKNNLEEKEIQTEKLDDEEYDKMKFIYEREKRILQLQIDDKTTEIDYLNKEIEKLENDNKTLKDKLNYDEADVLEKNILLESNLKDLRKKLEQSQSERLVLDNQCNTYIKSMKDKNDLIKKLEKELQEAKKNANTNNNNINQSQLNIVKKITGGGIY